MLVLVFVQATTSAGVPSIVVELLTGGMGEYPGATATFRGYGYGEGLTYNRVKYMLEG